MKITILTKHTKAKIRVPNMLEYWRVRVKAKFLGWKVK